MHEVIDLIELLIIAASVAAALVPTQYDNGVPGRLRNLLKLLRRK